MKKPLLLSLVLVFLVLVATPQSTAAPSLAGNFERTISSGAVVEIVKQYGGEYIVPIQERLWLDEVFRRLVEVTERGDLEYTLTVLNSMENNAFALPGGYIFVTRGLLRIIGSDEARLAGVLGHEMAHIEKRHGINAVLRQMGLTVLLEVGVMWLDLVSADLLRVASATLLQLLQLGWGREAEYEADVLGQTLAVEAGFDAIGAVALLDNLMEADSRELPMKIFRTHPDTNNRRRRLEANLVSFWSAPTRVTDLKTLETLSLGRNMDQVGRNDPNGRYKISVPAEEAKLGLEVYDNQTEQSIVWLQDVLVRDFVWAPQGHYLAVHVEQGASGQLWFCDRFGYVLKKWVPNGEIQSMNWSPEGQMLALDLKTDDGPQVVVTHIGAEVFVPVSGEQGGSHSLWDDGNLYFRRNGVWHYTKVPLVLPVVVPNPVPQVLQRQRILSPTVIKEGNTIRLTRPSLTLP